MTKKAVRQMTAPDAGADPAQTPVGWSLARWYNQGEEILTCHQ